MALQKTSTTILTDIMVRRLKNRRAQRNSSELHYTGPIHLRSGGLDSRITRVNLNFSSNAQSSSAGKFDGAWVSSQVTSCTDWTSFANVYQEYRVVGMEVKWLNRYNSTFSTSAAPGFGAMAVYHTPTIPTPVSIDEVVQNANHKLWNTGRPLTIQWRARGTEEMAWASTASSSSHGGIQIYAEGCTASSLYGCWILTFTVEFRGRK